MAIMFVVKGSPPSKSRGEKGEKRKMIILKTCERISLVAEEKEMMKGNMNIKIMFQNRIYNSDWKCESDSSQRPLYPNLRSEYVDNLDEAKTVWKETSKMFHAQPQTPQQPIPQEQPSQLGGKLEQMLVEVLAKQSVEQVVEFAKPLLEKHIINEFGVLPQKHEVITPKGTHEIQGVVHEKFDEVLNLVNLDIPVFLTGQAGTGKNVICKQIAEALGLEFYFTNAVTQEYQLKGFIDANGKFHETQFYKAFTQGGLFFLDEMDGSIPETLIILNSAIANRYFDFPIGKVEAHPDFRIVSAGNTCGTGADIEYTGRFQLDASSLDRFALIEVDYSPSIEEAVTNNNKELCEFARAFRDVTNKSGIRCLFTYRSLERIAKLENAFELPKVLKISLTKGLRKDDIRIISKELRMENKYAKALKYLY